MPIVWLGSIPSYPMANLVTYSIRIRQQNSVGLNSKPADQPNSNIREPSSTRIQSLVNKVAVLQRNSLKKCLRARCFIGINDVTSLLTDCVDVSVLEINEIVVMRLTHLRTSSRDPIGPTHLRPPVFPPLPRCLASTHIKRKTRKEVDWKPADKWQQILYKPSDFS